VRALPSRIRALFRREANSPLTARIGTRENGM
jgi:hypothetical protein